jgi:hypothetical protein
MQNPYFTDFYHGWIIEVAQTNGRFSSTCYSPSRERFSDDNAHASDFQAVSAAKRRINLYLAYHALSSFFRELYELDQLSFEEWRSLQQSLTKTKAAS